MTLDSQPLPYIANKPDVVFFTDFDGTITQEDSQYQRENICIRTGMRKVNWLMLVTLCRQ